MFEPNDTSPSPDWHQIAATWASANAIKTAFATPTVETEYSGAGINGAMAAGIRPTAHIEIATTLQANAYSIAAPFVITGVDYKGSPIEESIFLTQVSGNEVVSSTKPFAKVTKIKSPAHPLGTGSIQVGIGDLGFDPPARRILARAAGAIPTYTATKVLEPLTLAVGDKLDVCISRISKTAAVFPFVVMR